MRRRSRRRSSPPHERIAGDKMADSRAGSLVNVPRNFGQQRRQVMIRIGGCIKAVAAALLFALMPMSQAFAADEVGFALDWIVGGTHAGYYVALEKGYYKAANLDVTISRGFGS